MFRSGLLACVLVVLGGGTAAAQIEPEPIPLFAADVRAAIPRFKADGAVASDLSVTAADLPTMGLGLVAGAHIYPLRAGPVTFGFGAEILRSRATHTKEPLVEDGPEGPTIRTQLHAISPQLSLNFGHRDGWSYISGGLGSATLTSELEGTAAGISDAAPRSKTINYGGGARWFARKHLAVSLDLRFYAVSPRTRSASGPGYPRMTVMVFTGGIAFR